MGFWVSRCIWICCWRRRMLDRWWRSCLLVAGSHARCRCCCCWLFACCWGGGVGGGCCWWGVSIGGLAPKSGTFRLGIFQGVRNGVSGSSARKRNIHIGYIPGSKKRCSRKRKSLDAPPKGGWKGALRYLRCLDCGEGGVLLKRDTRINLLEGWPSWIWAEGDAVKAEIVEVVHDVGPWGDAGKPIAVLLLYQQDAGVRMTNFGAKGQIGWNMIVVFDGDGWEDREAARSAIIVRRFVERLCDQLEV